MRELFSDLREREYFDIYYLRQEALKWLCADKRVMGVVLRSLWNGFRDKEKGEDTLKGVNRTLYDWAISYTYFTELLNDHEKIDRLLSGIFGEDGEIRENASIEFYHLIWEHYPELGPSPLIEVLAEFEHDRVFYNDYRDHTTHMIKVFFLGMYFYDQVKYIRSAINNVLPKTNENTAAFIKLWTITALYHDIGYIFENKKIENYQKEWEVFRDKFNEMLTSPLSCFFQKLRITREKEKSFIKNNKIYMNTIDNIGELEAKDKNEEIWEIFQLGGKRSHLTNNDSINGIWEYYEFAVRRQTVDGRQGFMDHGICSALLLGKTWYAYFDYLKMIVKKNYDIAGLSPLDKNSLCDLWRELASTEPLVVLAANAIALHNINKEIWNKSDASSYHIFLNDFRLEFTELPVACLLKLCDEIQLWDRNRFRRPQVTDRITTGDDLELAVERDRIYLQFDYDNNFIEPQNFPDSEYSKLYGKLELYLKKTELDKILTCGKPEKVSQLKNRENHTNSIGTSSDKMESCPKSGRKKWEDEKEQWVIGAVNLNEDIHFSSFYLRQSMQKYLPSELKKFGYHNITAVYENFNEIYYIPKKECIEVSECLIDHCLGNVDFWKEIFSKIEEKIDVLNKVFADLPPKGSFQGLSNEEILEYYNKHNAAQRDLYIYANILEALDCGVPTFTMFLKDYLKGCSEELRDEEKLNEVFDALTYPEKMGCFGESILEMSTILSIIRKNITEKEKEEWRISKGRYIMRMKKEIVNIIEDYLNRWKFWEYHGYRDRAVNDFDGFLEDLKEEIVSERLRILKSILVNRQNVRLSERNRVLEKYNIKEKYETLFRVYSEIGIVKLKRCYFQLKNFYYLDQLLREIAMRYNVCESVVRCLLPDEMICLLGGDRAVLNKGIERENAKLFVYQLTDDEDKVTYDSETEDEARRMKSMTAAKGIRSRELFGEAVSKGTYCGVCRVMDWKGEDIFKRGEILVATDIESDKLNLLKLARAVVIENGSFTCYAAIVCRELEIPCIIGVHGAVDYIHTGQKLEIDTGKGRVKIMTPQIDGCIRSSDFDRLNITHEDIGDAAYSLMQLSRAGVHVSDFCCICLDTLKRSIDNGKSTNSLTNDIEDFVREMDEHKWWIIRSSICQNEDNIVPVTRGEIIRSHVHKDDIIRELYQIVNILKDYSGGGSIIIQKMIMGSYSGVIFTNNPEGSSDELVIYAAPGENEYLFSSGYNMVSYTYSKGLSQFAESGERAWKNLLSESQKEKLREQAMKIEKLFGAPQDIRWTAQKDDIYFLQSSQMTYDCGEEQEGIFSLRDPLRVDTESIYHAYGLPEHLKMHLLTTAAVVCWIMDQWKGDELDEEAMIKACLLHDIGKIVNEILYISPDADSEKALDYWKSMRKPIIEKYGTTDIEAALNIAKEINVSSDVLRIMKQMQFCCNEEIYRSADFAVKICAYADQRVSPEGIEALEERLDEARTRQAGSCENDVTYESLKRYAVEIQTQIFEQIEGVPEDINRSSITRYITGLRSYEF